jgi:hypothetical protein
MTLWSGDAVGLNAPVTSCENVLASWLAGVHGAAAGGSGLHTVLAAAVAGTLAGFAAAYLGSGAVASLAAAIWSFRRSDLRGRPAPPLGAGLANLRPVIYAGAAVAAGLAIVSCGSAPDRGVVDSFSSPDSPLSLGVGVGLVVGCASGILAAISLRSRRGAMPRPPGARVVRVAVACLPDSARGRWQEEWCGELSALPSRRARAHFCLSLLLGTPRMVWTLRRAAWRRRGG